MDDATIAGRRAAGRFWPDRRAVWRWHFYAGLFCIPFVVWLSVTGSIYLFKPQIDQLIDRPYDGLALDAPPAGAAAEVAAALAAIPGSRLIAYELPQAANDAARVIVRAGGQAIRVYVHPVTLRVLKQVPEESRFERIVFRLHGQLLLGNRGSVLVELAASWAVVMILTGLFLWWPRGACGLAGVLYPRLGAGGRRFWRDLHGVVGMWVSVLALFLLISGLPWSYAWGNLLAVARDQMSPSAAWPDWAVGAAPDHAGEHADGHGAAHGMGDVAGMQANGSAGMGGMPPGPVAAPGLAALDRVVSTVRPLGLAHPVLIAPPASGGAAWTARSDAQNRPLRSTVTIDARTGAITGRQDFGDRALIDRAVGIGVAAHEGQLFGWVNQLLGLLTAVGLTVVGVSGGVLWWRRRPPGVLGAPPATGPARATAPLLLALALLGMVLPEMGASMVLVLLAETLVLRRVPATRRWLGLERPA